MAGSGTARIDGRDWTDPEPLGGAPASAAAVTAWAADRMEVFAIFPDGELWNRYWDGVAWLDQEPALIAVWITGGRSEHAVRGPTRVPDRDRRMDRPVLTHFAIS
jgi:hypothetical protein